MSTADVSLYIKQGRRERLSISSSLPSLPLFLHFLSPPLSLLPDSLFLTSLSSAWRIHRRTLFSSPKILSHGHAYPPPHPCRLFKPQSFQQYLLVLSLPLEVRPYQISALLYLRSLTHMGLPLYLKIILPFLLPLLLLMLISLLVLLQLDRKTKRLE